MRQTLFRIPLDGPWSLGPLGEVPGFGFGVVLAAWILFAVWWLYRNRPSLALKAEFIAPAVVWCLVAWVIVMIPRWVQRGTDALIAESTRVIKRNEEPALAHIFRGRAWQSKRQYDRAIDDYEASIQLDPKSDAAHARLAWLLATCPDAAFRDGKRAVKHARVACELTDFRRAEYVDILAAARAEEGRFEEAIKWAKKAAVLAYHSMDVTVRVRLSEIRNRLGAYVAHTPFRDTTAGKSLPVYGYGFMLFVGLFAGIQTATRRAVRAGFKPDVIWDVALWGFFAGVVGGRLFYIVQYYQRVFADCKTLADYGWAAVNLTEGGLVLYGGLILGTLTVVGYCRLKKLNVLLLGDVIVPSIFVGLAFGRLGCLMNGCCYGGRCDLPWAISFPLGSVPDMAFVLRDIVPPDEIVPVRLHPTQVYSSLNALLIAALTHWYFKYRRRDGILLGVALLGYPVARFIIEFLRSDEPGRFGTPLTISQWVSIGLFSAGLLYVFWVFRRPASLSPAVRENEGEVSRASPSTK